MRHFRACRANAFFIWFAVSTIGDLVLCATTSVIDTSGTSSSATFDFRALNSSRAFLLPTRTERRIGKEHENRALGSLNLHTNSVHDINTLPLGSSPGHGATTPYNGEYVLLKSRKPIVFRLFPKSGPRLGRTRITIFGANFNPTGREVCRFGSERDGAEVDLVRATILKNSKMVCFTPLRSGAGRVVVSVSSDGYTFSGATLTTAQGSETFVFFNFTDHVPSGHFTIDNITGPFAGGTLITVTLNTNAAKCDERTTYQATFNFTKRIHLSDKDIAFVDNSLYNVMEQQNASHVSSMSAAYFRVSYKGLMYDVVTPSSSASTQLDDQCWNYYDGISSLTSNITFEEVDDFAVAAQNASHNADGCLGPTHNATVECLKSLEPYILVVEARILEYTITRRTCLSHTSLGRFEPSNHAKCMFSFYGSFLPVETSDRSIMVSEVITVPAKWDGYNRLKCISPRRHHKATFTGPSHGGVPLIEQPALTTEAATLRVSNDGIHFSQPAATFTFNSSVPDVFNVYTLQESGRYKARGPWTGNTEVYINGTNFLPAENLKARFIIYNETDHLSGVIAADSKSILEQRQGGCVYDTPEQIRCISPKWYPSEHLLSRIGSLNPCFLVDIEVSNDGGMQWSMSAGDKFLYCPVYVSTYGSNSWGEGTPRLPFRDISRAIQASLSEPRSYFLYKGVRPSGKSLAGRQQRGTERRSGGLARYVNLDQILLMDGIYQDRFGIFGPERNLNLIAHGRVIEVSYSNFHLVFDNFEMTKHFHISDNRSKSRASIYRL